MATRSFSLYQTDAGKAAHPDAFELADRLTYPPASWWRKANPPPKLSRSRARRVPRVPTRAQYWQRYDRRRLLQTTPLRGESKANARKRVTRARSYFARLDNYEFRVAKGEARDVTEWRIVLRGEIHAVPRPGQQPGKVMDGRQASPWERVTPGIAVPDFTLRARYLDTARRAIAVTAAHAPDWSARLGTFDEKHGYNQSDMAILFPDGGVTLEVRRV